MNIKTDKNLLKAAIDNGCKTAAELAHYIRIHLMMTRTYRQI